MYFGSLNWAGFTVHISLEKTDYNIKNLDTYIKEFKENTEASAKPLVSEVNKTLQYYPTSFASLIFLQIEAR